MIFELFYRKKHTFFYKISINNYMKKDYIYIISNNEGCIKIGISKHPSKRLKQLQTGNQSQLTLWYAEEFECSRKHLIHIEHKIHKECKYLCEDMQGEWFKILPENLNRLKNLLIYHRIRYENDENYFINNYR